MFQHHSVYYSLIFMLYYFGHIKLKRHHMKNVTITTPLTASASIANPTTTKATNMKTDITYNSTSDRFSLATKKSTSIDIIGTLEVVNKEDTAIITITWAKDNKTDLVIDLDNKAHHGMIERFTKALKERFIAMRNLAYDINHEAVVTTPKATTPKPKKAKKAKEISPKQLAKKAIKEASHSDYSADTSNLIDTLHTITENKAEVKKIQSDIKHDIKSVIPLINSYVKTMRDENVIYKNAKKATLVKLIKTRLDSKENVIAVMCDVLIEGINLDNTHSLAIIKYTVKCIKNGNFTKSAVNKADKAKLIKMCDSQKAKDALERAKKLIKG